MARPRARSPLRDFHPIVREWFAETLGAFLWELNALITEGLAAPLANAVHLLYVSPLKALNNDIQRNLERPLAELQGRFERAGERFPEIRVAVRTGDTPPSARARMMRRTPHILITTPESLHIMLTSVKGRGMFSALRAVIVDEIHAVAGSKRGAHLALTLERLAHLCEQTPGARAPQRIGLSATQRPLEEIAKFLTGMQDEGGTRDPGRGTSEREQVAAVKPWGPPPENEDDAVTASERQRSTASRSESPR